MSNSQHLAEEYAESLAGTLADIWEAIDGDTEYEEQDAREYLDEMPLEIVRETGKPFTVVLTTGGPHAEIESHLDSDGDGTTGAKLEVYWSTGNARRYGKAIERTADYFAEVTNH